MLPHGRYPHTGVVPQGWIPPMAGIPSLGWSQGAQRLLMDIILPLGWFHRAGPLLMVIIIFTRVG